MRYVVIGAGWLWGFATLPQVTDAATSFGWGFVGAALRSRVA
jgi:hypothetical protein